jgi:hypothetical protein
MSAQFGTVLSMSANKDKQLSKRQAWGTTVAATPLMKEMQQQVAGWFAEGVPEDEIRVRLRAEAVEGDHGLRAFLGFNRKAMRRKAADAVVDRAKLQARELGNKMMSQVLAEYASAIGVDKQLADWQIAWYKTGSPPPLAQGAFGAVRRIALGPKDEEVPMIFALAGPLSDPEVIAKEFVNRWYQEFPQSFARKEHAERDAERVRLFAENVSDFDIAKAELEVDEWSQRALNKREYNQVVRSRANSITQARKRWLEYVTNSLEWPSPSSD